MEPDRIDEVGDEHVATAIESLRSAAFTSRFVRTDCQADDPKWTADDGQPIRDHVSGELGRFADDIGALAVRDVHGSVFHRFVGSTHLTVADHRRLEPTAPSPRDLLHVYGPDRDDIKDWRRFYRYAWTDKGPHAMIFSTESQIVRQGLLSCNSYAYSGQSSFALAGAGVFYIPESGDAKISIRPYVQWQTRASFSGTEHTPAAATALIGIYVESWTRITGTGYHVDRDHWVTAFSQNTQSFATGVTASGAATVTDGLATEVLAVSQRRYNIFVYVYLETTAAPQAGRNELRFTTIDIDATVPYLVVQETLM